jgi:hypothetical protein
MTMVRDASDSYFAWGPAQLYGVSLPLDVRYPPLEHPAVSQEYRCHVCNGNFFTPLYSRDRRDELVQKHMDFCTRTLAIKTALSSIGEDES